MQLPHIDRSAIRPAGGEVVAPAGLKVIPVAPTNPGASPPSQASVVNDINPDVQARAQEERSADPLQGGSRADETHKDWTQRKEGEVKRAQEPPKEPLSKLLMEHIHTLWSASARVVEIWMQNNPAQNPAANQQLQVQQQAASRQTDPQAAPGIVAKEVLTYSPNRIKRPEKAE